MPRTNPARPYGTRDLLSRLPGDEDDQAIDLPPRFPNQQVVPEMERVELPGSDPERHRTTVAVAATDGRSDCAR
jgi:hypothetical protein